MLSVSGFLHFWDFMALSAEDFEVGCVCGFGDTRTMVVFRVCGLLRFWAYLGSGVWVRDPFIQIHTVTAMCGQWTAVYRPEEQTRAHGYHEPSLTHPPRN